MVSNINTLRFHVCNWIFNKCYCTLNFTGTNSRSTTSFKNSAKYATSWHATDNAIYSASHVERATDDCFFDFPLIAGPLSDNSPKYYTYFPVMMLSQHHNMWTNPNPFFGMLNNN